MGLEGSVGGGLVGYEEEQKASRKTSLKDERKLEESLLKDQVLILNN